MSWTNRLRLWGGLLATVLLVAVLTLVFNQRQIQATSQSANVAAPTYAVGADYGGTVIKQDVEEGARVTKGQELFTVQSLQLKSEIAKGLEIGNSDSYTVDKARGAITYMAPRDGLITTLDAKLGNSIPTGTAMAELTVTTDRYVDAYLQLTPRDYARLERGAAADILMPNNQTIRGTVQGFAVETAEDGSAKTRVRIETADLQRMDEVGLGNPGTPVVTTIRLRDDGPLAGVNDLAVDFLRQIGLK